MRGGEWEGSDEMKVLRLGACSLQRSLRASNGYPRPDGKARGPTNSPRLLSRRRECRRLRYDPRARAFSSFLSNALARGEKTHPR
jgi:hypothetical protein